MAFRAPALAIAVLFACGEGDGTSATITTTNVSSASTQPATDDTGSSSSGPACMQYLDTFEGCGVNGCAAGPTNLDGIVPAGAACAMAPECAPSLCTCASDPSVQWFAASCGCGECASDEVACERSRSLVACL